MMTLWVHSPGMSVGIDHVVLGRFGVASSGWSGDLLLSLAGQLNTNVVEERGRPHY